MPILEHKSNSIPEGKNENSCFGVLRDAGSDLKSIVCSHCCVLIAPSWKSMGVPRLDTQRLSCAGPGCWFILVTLHWDCSPARWEDFFFFLRWQNIELVLYFHLCKDSGVHTARIQLTGRQLFLYCHIGILDAIHASNSQGQAESHTALQNSGKLHFPKSVPRNTEPPKCSVDRKGTTEPLAPPPSPTSDFQGSSKY